MRALALAKPSAVGQVLAALPTTRGEGAFRTAVAKSREVSGAIRAARVLARLGPEACTRALEHYTELGYRARNAVARALATVPEATGRAVDPARVRAALELTLAYGETLTRALPSAGRASCATSSPTASSRRRTACSTSPPCSATAI